jgi:hypothetical protein
MASRKKNVDPFLSLRPRALDVPVGDHILSLKTSTLDQETRMLEAISDLDLGRVFKPIGEMLSLNADGEEANAIDLIPKIAKLGPEIWGAIREVLGKQFVPTMRLVSIALLDTPANKRLLIGNEAIPTDSPEERTEDGAWLGCDAVHRFIQDEITLVQSTYLLKSAFDLNGYATALGNLLPLMTGGDQVEPEAKAV